MLAISIDLQGMGIAGGHCQLETVSDRPTLALVGLKPCHQHAFDRIRQACQKNVDSIIAAIVDDEDRQAVCAECGDNIRHSPRMIMAGDDGARSKSWRHGAGILMKPDVSTCAP
jgi:hypothetical protein